MKENTAIIGRRSLSGWPMILGWLGMIIFAFHASTHMVGAGDTWVAMACGRHFLDHGVDTVEPFSANSHKAGPTEQEIRTWPGWAQWITDKVGLETVNRWHPTGWVNQNWLTHVIFYWLTSESPFADAESLSFNTLVYWKFALYILAVICVYYTGRLLGVNPALAAAFACFSMFIGRSFFDVRPAGFSNLLVAVFLLILVLATYRHILYIWLMVPVVAFWCNVHGGYVYVFIMLVPFVALHFLTSFSKKRFVSIGLRGVYHTIAAGAACFLAMIIFNPFHLTNLTHTFEISLSPHAERWRTVNEWHPGFEWSNPVGTGFPFLVLFILCIGIPVFWLYGRVLKPRFLKAPKNEMEQQRRLFTIMSKILGWSAAIFTAWVVFISFSFLDLSAGSFLVCALFTVILLLSVCKNIHFIYLQVPLILLALWATANKAGYSGAYIYPFVLLPCYVIVHLIASWVSDNVRIKPLNIVFAAATTVTVFLLMVAIFNPFRFGRLLNVGLELQSSLDSRMLPQRLRTDFENRGILLSEDVTVLVEEPGSKWLIIDNRNEYPVRSEQRRLYVYKPGSAVWQIKEALHIRRLFTPRYEGQYRATYSRLFAVLYILNGLSFIVWIAVWLVSHYLRAHFSHVAKEAEGGQESSPEPYKLPKIDLSLLAIAGLTVYMAYRSRRFIPIAAIAGCPVLAMLIDQMVRGISASFNFHGRSSSAGGSNASGGKRKVLTVPSMPGGLKILFVLAGAAAVTGLGTWWGLKFKCVYLDPWPTDPKLTSVFMRMTASDAKPFYVCRFIKDNRLKGKMFNYWTEGGFIAWGQAPDPNTGKTPLQLFMDGRAQAAYMIRIYDRWSQIMSGGAITNQLQTDARLRRQSLGADEYRKIGDWLDRQLSSEKVWVVLMPAGQFATPFVRGLNSSPNWRLAFFNNKQKLFVRIDDPQGKALFDGIFTGTTVYPDEYSKDLILAHHLLLQGRSEAERRRGFDHAVKAFEFNPSQAPIHKIIYSARFPELRTEATRFCQDYVKEFGEKSVDWAKQDGYHHRVVAALNATSYLRQLAQRQKNTELVRSYNAKVDEYNIKRNELLKTKRW
jgi:hypothetical protein